MGYKLYYDPHTVFSKNKPSEPVSELRDDEGETTNAVAINNHGLNTPSNEEARLTRKPTPIPTSPTPLDNSSDWIQWDAGANLGESSFSPSLQDSALVEQVDVTKTLETGNVKLSSAVEKRRHRKHRKRLGLPIMFEGQISDVTTVACADTGADSNVIAYALVKSLALSISVAEDSVKEFRLANGKIVRSIGTISSRCDLAPGQSSMVEGLACFFYVFETLAVPIILGLPLLEETETLSKYRDRLVEQTISVDQSLQVNLVGSPARLLLCNLNGELTTANADSGSDADFLSAAYAQSRGFIVEPDQETIQFADGSIDFTVGRCDLSLAIEDLPATPLEFHVCAALAHDVIVGYGSIDEFDVFTRHRSSLISSMDEGMRLEPIRLLETLSNSGIKSTLNKLIGRSDGKGPPAISSPATTPLPPSPSGALFICEYPGCNAEPFQSRYLLSSHANVHSSSPPYFCYLQGCPRSLGGKGFKRKSEVIRHGMIHKPPGYVCPFCPDREVKSSRSEALQRHVRVCHPEKGVDDPILAEIISQKPHKPNRRRERPVRPDLL